MQTTLTGTLSNARLGLIPTANIADSAVTAPKIATGQVVKTLNGMTDNVTLAAGSNITITPSGNTLTIASTGGAGILNQTTLQAGANFNIGGGGTANIFDVVTQYNLGGSRILGGSDSGGNVFAGFNVGTVNQRCNNSFFGNNTGAANTFGSANSFFGFNAGPSNTNGSYNTFVGVGSGILNANGGDNTFVGAGAGQQNIVGQGNSFFGLAAGLKNTSDFNSFFGVRSGANTTSGSLNVFAGLEAGIGNITGSNNVFVGTRTGEFDTTGASNTFIGGEAGRANSNGSGNTYVGYNAQGNIGGNNLTNATAIGANAAVLQSNSLILGSINGVNSATADTRIGIGTTVPKAKLDVTGGNLLIATPGQGIILKSPDGVSCRLRSN